jgi:tetratricopeptide (TPR) repeat protein
VSRSKATLEELFGLLPDIEELELLRLALVGVAVPNPGKEWDSSSAYSTIDKRVVRPEQLDEVVQETEDSLHVYVSSLFEGLRPLFRSFWSGDAVETVQHLVELGERQEQEGLFRKARNCYDVALSLSLPLTDKGPQILALRRIGRMALSLGDLQDAHSYYQRSAELAHDSGDLHAEIIARTGVGNARLWQGRLAEAQQFYESALALAGRVEAQDGIMLERAQLYNNLGNVTTRQMHLDAAEGWFAKAEELWAIIPSPLDRAVCHHNRAHLLLAQGKRERAREVYQETLALTIPPGLWAGIAIDIAETCLQDGLISQAEEWGRAAEERAIASRSPYSLARMYQGRGNIARALANDGGFIFFEKALQIVREKDYRLLEGDILLDYSLLRQQTGGIEEAQAYLECAREIFLDLGAAHELVRAEMALRGLRGDQELATAS